MGVRVRVRMVRPVPVLVRMRLAGCGQFGLGMGTGAADVKRMVVSEAMMRRIVIRGEQALRMMPAAVEKVKVPLTAYSTLFLVQAEPFAMGMLDQQIANLGCRPDKISGRLGKEA